MKYIFDKELFYEEFPEDRKEGCEWAELLDGKEGFLNKELNVAVCIYEGKYFYFHIDWCKGVQE